MGTIDGLQSISPKDDSRSVYPGKITVAVVFACVTAASGGLMFGYDLGISGGVTGMDDFLVKFFPEVYRQRHAKETDNYCKFDSEVLTAFTSSLYLAGLIASFFASITTRKYGRKLSMLIGGVSFLTGSIVNGAALDVAMLILGRIMLGVGVGFAAQAVPVYLSEIAPPKFRGALVMMFHMAVGTGVLIANLINYGTNKLIPWGWRLSLGLGAVPATFMTLGSLFMPDTPSSLIERNHTAKGRAVLQSIRGTSDVEAEYDDLVEASEISNSVKHPWRNILQRRYRPQLVMGFFIPFFQQVTGINVITFYAPVLFQTIGFGADAALYSSVIIGGFGLLSTILSSFVVDKFGRRKLFLVGGCIMLGSQVIVAIILALKLGPHVEPTHAESGAVVILITVYVIAFSWSWGPLGWVVPGEIFPMEVRSAGMSMNVMVNLAFTYLIAQLFLSMICHLKWGLFFFFAGWTLVMTLFVLVLLPETKNIPLEETYRLWQLHPIWRSFSMPPHSPTSSGRAPL